MEQGVRVREKGLERGLERKPTIPKVSPGSKFETGLKKFAALKP